MSLATRRFGSNFLSVGRVQSPTLALIVERELERRAHVPKPYWELFARFAHPDGAFEAHHATDKFWERAEADAALAQTKSPGVVERGQLAAQRSASRRRPTTRPRSRPTPRAGSGSRRRNAMRIAEDLYMDGFISYPRTDNTVYPPSLNTRELVSSLVRIPRVLGRGPAARRQADADARAQGDHRPPADPSHPGAAPRRARGPQAARLRARRAALPRHLLRADDHRVHARRHRGGLGDVLRARLGRRRPRLRRDLHLRALLGRRDPEARGGPDARPRRRPLDRRQGDPAAVADQPGQADRDDGGARPRHEGDARRHHPEALRPRLRLQQPAAALGDRDRDVQGVPRVRAADGDAGDDRRARAGHGRDRGRQGVQGRRRSAISREMLHATTAAAPGPEARTSRS